MNSVEIHQDWIDLLAAMLQKQVRFLIVGGHAVSVHGHPRYTEDLDIFGEMSESQFEVVSEQFLNGLHGPRTTG